MWRSWDIDLEKAEETADKIRERGRIALPLEIDVAALDQVEAGFETTRKTLGEPDILVNNAGICPVSRFSDIDPEEWDRVMAVNLRGTFLCCRAVLETMKHRRRGWIVNMSSAAGKSGGRSVSAHYSASKAGIMCLTRSLALEMAPYGVMVNAVAPGPVETGMIDRVTGGNPALYQKRIPLGRLARPEEIAAAVVFLCSDGAGFITGETMNVNGGQLMD